MKRKTRKRTRRRRGAALGQFSKPKWKYSLKSLNKMKQASKQLPNLEKGWDANLSDKRKREEAYNAMLKAARHNAKTINPLNKITAKNVYKKLGMGGRRRKTKRRRRKRTRRRRR